MKKLVTTSKRLEKAKNWSMKELEKENNFLYVGDVVMWAGAWGHEPYKKAKVESITVVEPGTKYGDDVETLHWNFVRDRDCIIGLDNTHWCWGFQVKKVEHGTDTK